MSDQCEGREAGDGGRVNIEEDEVIGLHGHNHNNIQSFKVQNYILGCFFFLVAVVLAAAHGVVTQTTQGDTIYNYYLFQPITANVIMNRRVLMCAGGGGVIMKRSILLMFCRWRWMSIQTAKRRN